MGSPLTTAAMPRTTSTPAKNLLMAGLAALAILLPLLRLYLVAGGRSHRGHHWVTTQFGGRPARAAQWNLSDRFEDGTPEFMRLTNPADQAAFRQWFTAIADYQAIRPHNEVPAEIVDCASLLRYAYREALKRHSDSWFTETGMEVASLPGEIAAWHYPQTPLGANLFRVREGSFLEADEHDGTFAEFADAKTLIEHNAFFVTRDVREAQPADLLFYRQFGQSSPWHSMIVTRIGAQPGVVYDTGADHGAAGELRRVSMAELIVHPQPAWRPVVSNPNFLGVYRWNILRGTL